MWIPKKMSDDGDNRRAMSGSIVYSDSDKTTVSTVENCNFAAKLAPYGIAYVPPTGEKAVVIPVENTQYCAGVISPTKSDLSPGELMLFSSGGASVVLKNDGTVLINGQTFAAEE